MTASKILLVIAIILWMLAAVQWFGGFSFGWLGMAFYGVSRFIDGRP